ncbi:cytochrome P450 81Q32-like isoform X2 [Rhododendron vialii]|uniref:cytochrome P450 81Q32-like isoform X2 n=1 Tax=Rhododendron vialii TaxID=182163 RepID=UPI00265E05CF|nr:cytochrome P450 81Q32-like isoform X2 [Rhododendron vialii]
MEIPYIFLLFIFFTYFLTKHLLQKHKNLPPSPFPSLPVIGHLHLLKKPLSRTLAALSKTHGPILLLRFGSRPVLIVSSPSAAEECFTKNDVVFANRPKLLAGKHVGHNYTTIIWSSYGQHLRNLRRIASTEILSANRIQMLKTIRFDEVRLLLGRLYRSSSDGDYIKVDMKSVLFEVTLNNMMRMIAGKRYYGDKMGGLEEETRKFKEMVTETFLLGGATNIGDFVPVLNWFGLNGLDKRLKVLQHKRDTFMQDLIEKHRRENESENDQQRSKTMVDVLLSLKKDEPECYTDEVISGIMQVMLIGGSDTSAGTMEWALSLLLNNPDILGKAYFEIEKHVGTQNRLIEESDLNELPYLNKIIKETLRMCPPNHLLLPHESSQECTIGGFRIPRGTMLLVNAWAIQNDPELWHEPNKFKPERWGDMDDARFSFIPFGFGRRGCPGEGLAMRVIGLGLASVIQCFEWEREGEEMVDMTEGTGVTTPKALPLVAKCRPRRAMVNLLSQLRE